MCAYEVPNDVVFTAVEEECVLLHPPSGEYFSLNSMGREMFDLIRTGNHKADILKSLLKDYDVDEKTLNDDLDTLITQLLRANLLKEKQS
jgi:PqqD family protein of HPr-rel-A system